MATDDDQVVRLARIVRRLIDILDGTRTMSGPLIRGDMSTEFKLRDLKAELNQIEREQGQGSR